MNENKTVPEKVGYIDSRENTRLKRGRIILCKGNIYMENLHWGNGLALV